MWVGDPGGPYTGSIMSDPVSTELFISIQQSLAFLYIMNYGSLGSLYYELRCSERLTAERSSKYAERIIDNLRDQSSKLETSISTAHNSVSETHLQMSEVCNFKGHVVHDDW